MLAQVMWQVLYAHGMALMSVCVQVNINKKMIQKKRKKCHCRKFTIMDIFVITNKKIEL